jgi:hypothetical protein
VPKHQQCNITKLTSNLMGNHGMRTKRSQKQSFAALARISFQKDILVVNKIKSE